MPGSIRHRLDEDIGHDRLDRGAAESPARVRVEATDLGNHIEHVFIIDAADLTQAGEIPLSQKVEIGDKRLHGRIERSRSRN